MEGRDQFWAGKAYLSDVRAISEHKTGLRLLCLEQESFTFKAHMPERCKEVRGKTSFAV